MKKKSKENIEIDKKNEEIDFEKFEEDHKKLNTKVSSPDEMSDYMDERIPTGSVILDCFLGGGFKCGFSRFWGEPEHGKSANALAWSKSWLENVKNSYVIYFDAENRLSKELLDASGIDFKKGRFRWSHNNICEEIGDTIKALVKEYSQNRFFFVIDSFDALLKKDDAAKSFDQFQQVAGVARFGSIFLKEMSPFIRSQGNHLMVLSQTRTEFNTTPHGTQAKKTASGGKALQFYSSLTAEIMENFNTDYGGGCFFFEKKNDPKTKRIGHYFTLKFEKTYHEKSGEKVRIPIKYGHGVWHEKECVDLSVGLGLLDRGKSGWYEFEDEAVSLAQGIGEELPRKFHGEEKLLDFLENNGKITWVILNHIREFYTSDDNDSFGLQLEDDGEISDLEG